MNCVFADTFYWVALAYPKDEWHKQAHAMSKLLRGVRFLTTDEVLVEFLADFGSAGRILRAKAARMVRSILKDPNIDVMPQTHETFLAGLALYEGRPDKSYSLTDCISMNTMNKYGVTEVLTHDQHFVQEGFQALFRT